jgi:hypothetical protein
MPPLDDSVTHACDDGCGPNCDGRQADGRIPPAEVDRAEQPPAQNLTPAHFSEQEIGFLWTLAIEEQFYLLWPACSCSPWCSCLASVGARSSTTSTASPPCLVADARVSVDAMGELPARGR